MGLPILVNIVLHKKVGIIFLLLYKNETKAWIFSNKTLLLLHSASHSLLYPLKPRAVQIESNSWDQFFESKRWLDDWVPDDK